MATFTPKALPDIEINGKKYPLKMNEAETVARMNAISELAEEMSKGEKATAKDILRACKEMEQFVNDLCGDGAMYDMVNGAVMSIRDTVELVRIIEQEASAAFAHALVERNA